jgi:disulfide bond formation protein DsbB
VTKAELIDSVSTAYATLAILLVVLVALLALLALAALVFAPARRALGWVRETLRGSELWLAFAIALGATLGSLFLSEYADFLPCRLCWMQRIAMYPLVVILFVAAIKRDRRNGVHYAITFPVVGAGIAIYHLYIEANPEADGCSVKSGGVPCSTKWIDVFGFITIPGLALAAFLAILALLLLAWPRRSDEELDAASDDEEDDDEDEGLDEDEPAAPDQATAGT